MDKKIETVDLTVDSPPKQDRRRLPAQPKEAKPKSYDFYRRLAHSLQRPHLELESLDEIDIEIAQKASFAWWMK